MLVNQKNMSHNVSFVDADHNILFLNFLYCFRSMFSKVVFCSVALLHVSFVVILTFY